MLPRPFLWVTGLTAALSAAALGVTLQPDRTFAPGTTIAGIDVSGLSKQQATDLLNATPSPGHAVTVRADGRTWTVDATQLGWTLDAHATVQAAANDESSLVGRVLNRPLGSGEARLFAKVDPSAARATLDILTADLNRAPVRADVTFRDGRFVLLQDTAGTRANTQATADAFAANPDLTELTVHLQPVTAALTAEQLRPHVERGNRLTRALTLTLQDGDKALTLNPSQVADLFWVRAAGIEPDFRTITAAVDRVNREVGREARDARFVPSAGQLVVQPDVVGLQVQRKEAIRALADAVLNEQVSSARLPARTVTPTLRAADLPDPNALSVIASGTSAFLGSSAERTANVLIAARKLTGYVVPAGGEFSFLKAVGRIEAESGFKEALVIMSGRTVGGVGGGVCQVSTTAFRALYNAGLPVIERNQHAYRVKWYEPQVGFEAAVYDPGVDLRMRNDTGGPMLVRTFTNEAKGILEVRLYGVPQTRKVTFSPATILDTIPHPEPQYVVNPDLKPGQQKQVDWAVNGYNLFITRTITDAQGTRTEKLSTRYRPWQAVYEVGPDPKKDTVKQADAKGGTGKPAAPNAPVKAPTGASRGNGG